MKKAIKINENGYFLEDVIVEDDFEQTENIITVPYENVGFYLPRWDGEKWIEGKTAEEIQAIKNQVPPKTEIEILRETVDTLVMSMLEV